MTDKRLRILIVDDSPEDRATYRRLISRDNPGGFEFFETYRGEEGLELALKEKPDCILLDYNLPDLNGLGFIDRLRAQEGERLTPVVMLTGQGNEAVAAEAIKRGAQDYLAKQINRNDIKQVVTRAIDLVALVSQREAARREVQQLAEERTRLVEQLQKQADELREAGRRKDEFLAILAHELRNPLGPIRNAARILSIAQATDSDFAEARTVIERQVGHMSRLIDDLLDTSRLSTGKMSLQINRLDLAQVARTAAADHRAGIEAAGQVLRLDLPAEPAWVDGDPVRLAQVIANLLHNASKFTPRGGGIALGIALHPHDVVASVSDDGIGMDAKQIAVAFDSFNRVSRPVDANRGGLGLGLALSKGLIEMHRGSITAESDGRGKGSCISFTIPRAQAPATSTSPPSTEKPAASLRVLIIEDNVDAAHALKTFLRLLGHQPLIAHSAAQGIQSAREYQPHVVLCDIGLPDGMSGYDVARALRKDPVSRPAYLVAMTGHGQDEDKKQARDAGFDLHLTKPVDPSLLEAVLKGI